MTSGRALAEAITNALGASLRHYMVNVQSRATTIAEQALNAVPGLPASHAALIAVLTRLDGEISLREPERAVLDDAKALQARIEGAA